MVRNTIFLIDVPSVRYAEYKANTFFQAKLVLCLAGLIFKMIQLWTPQGKSWKILHPGIYLYLFWNHTLGHENGIKIVKNMDFELKHGISRKKCFIQNFCFNSLIWHPGGIILKTPIWHPRV